MSAIGRRVAIVQSSYIPWKGYFDLINSVDEFILFDDAQYTRRDWRNRNRIKTPRGPLWVSIPVKVSGRYYQLVRETEIASADWGRIHWATITCNYARAPYFSAYSDLFKELYLNSNNTRLSEINHRFLVAICGVLGIKTRLSWSMDYESVEGQNEKLIHFCHQLNGNEYLSGPSARIYIDPAKFERAGISLRYMDYDGYPEYPQLYGAFEHHVSIIDLLFNVGPAATQYMKSFARASSAAGLKLAERVTPQA